MNNVSVTDTPFAIPFTTSLEVMVIAGGHVPHMMGKWVWVRADWSEKSVGNEEFCTTFYRYILIECSRILEHCWMDLQKDPNAFEILMHVTGNGGDMAG